MVVGGQVGIGEHARIEEGVMLGGQGGVPPNKVLRGKGVAFWGTPARPVREYLKQLAASGAAGKKRSMWSRTSFATANGRHRATRPATKG